MFLWRGSRSCSPLLCPENCSRAYSTEFSFLFLSAPLRRVLMPDSLILPAWPLSENAKVSLDFFCGLGYTSNCLLLLVPFMAASMAGTFFMLFIMLLSPFLLFRSDTQSMRRAVPCQGCLLLAAHSRAKQLPAALLLFHCLRFCVLSAMDSHADCCTALICSSVNPIASSSSFFIFYLPFWYCLNYCIFLVCPCMPKHTETYNGIQRVYTAYKQQRHTTIIYL